MAEQNTIPAEMLDAAVEVMVRGEFTQPAANLVLQTANATLERIKLTAKIALEAAGVPALLAELAEYKASSDLRWNADQRAIQRWKTAHPEQPLTWPDHTDLCVWLMGRIVELEVVANDLFPLALAHAAVYQVGHELPNLHETHSEIIERAKSAIGGFRS